VPGGGKSAEGAEEALHLLRLLGLGYRLRSQHRCKEAVDAFSRLPPLHYRSAWVLAQLGRAHADAADYAQAERTFGALRSLCPFQLEGLEHYSTVLWHLKRDTQLAQLAHEALALDRLSPVAWCVVGNCLSLQREHEAALRAFGRAASLDVECTYAYTLAGHEHLAAEDWEQAKRSYRIATALDGRHYNAWYGLGAVFMRQEKYDLAEYHFRRALDCHPSSSVLRCCLGQALHAVGRHEEALQELNAAVAADARNPLARFERASLLVSKGALQEALKELSALKDVAPREASVYVLLSKVYKRLNQPGLAALCAGTGADLGGAKEAGREEEEETVRGGDVVPV
jgi:anaphase-promoting complex subunit 3